MYQLLQKFFERMNQAERMDWLTCVYESENSIMISFIRIDEAEEAPE